MEPIAHQERLTRRALWLIRLRWIAILGICAATYLVQRLWGVLQQDLALYGVASVLVLENVVCLWFLHWVSKQESERHTQWIRRSIQFQICADLVLLTALLHFSGGVENPFMVFFIFHMAIASTLFSERESYMFAAFAVVLLMGIGLLEYQGIVPHYCLKGILTSGFHMDGAYVWGTLGVMAGTLLLVVYMTSNIASRLRHQEAAYRSANTQLEQKDRIKNEYVARVTHDIKGHLAAIQSCHDVVVSGLVGPLTEPQKDFIERAHDRTDALNKFVRALLSLTEMRLADDFEMSSFFLRDATDRAMEMAEPSARDKHITLVNHEVSMAMEVMGHRVSIEAALSNLLANAVKYTPAGGQVDLSVEVQADHVCVTVKDTGIGIPKAEVSRIFDEFFRGSNAGAMEKEGTGLGLSLVRQVIERHHGIVSVSSQEGSGSEFQFTLPLSGGQAHGL